MKKTFTIDFGNISNDEAESLMNDVAMRTAEISGYDPDDPDESRSRDEAVGDAIAKWLMSNATEAATDRITEEANEKRRQETKEAKDRLNTDAASITHSVE